MPMRKLVLRPGVDTQRSPTLNEAGISDTQLVRFPFGLPEKQGGWRAFPNIPNLIGTCRGLFAWADFNGSPYLAAGTNQRLQLLSSGSLYDITPLRATTNPIPGFGTQAGSLTIAINDPDNQAAVGDWIEIVIPVSVGGIVVQPGYYQVVVIYDGNTYGINLPNAPTTTVTNGGAVPLFTVTTGSSTVTVTLANHGYAANQEIWVISTAVGGITLSGFYTILSIINANTFTISAASAATSTASAYENGGATQIWYLIRSSFAYPTAIQGYGIGDYGAGDWGIGSSSTTTVQARQWSLFNWGQDLIASPSRGLIYHWSPPNPYPAQVISPTAPTDNKLVFGMGQAQIIISAGCEALGTYYPTLVRWCDSGDYTDWTATTTNQAGSYQIPTGSTAVAGLAIGLGALIWTDVDLWSMNYIGTPFIFSFNRISVACEPLGAHAPAVVPGNVVVWPGPKGFFRQDGGTVMPMPCSVWDAFFKQLDRVNQAVTCAAVNTLFSEVSWFYPRTDGQIGYVRWNYQNNLWDLGVLDRTAWTDFNPLNYPIASDSNGKLYRHEEGVDADGQPLAWSFTTGYFDLADGEEFTFVDLLLPDFVGTYSEVDVTLYATDAPNLTPRQYGPYALGPGTEYLNVRVRGRQMSMKFSGSDLGSQVRLGGVRYRFAAAGRR